MEKNNKNTEGWWLNKKGDYIHPDLVKVEDKLKSEMIDSIMNQAGAVNSLIKEFKDSAFDEVDTYFSLLFEKYKIEPKKGAKGNYTLENFSGTSKVQVSVADAIAFDEKLQIAKHKIDEYLTGITANSSSDIQVLIKKVFDVDKKGEVNPRKILALKSYDIKNPLWLEAMEIINEAVEVTSSKSYIRFYTRENKNESYKQVSLDIAGV